MARYARSVRPGSAQRWLAAERQDLRDTVALWTLLARDPVPLTAAAEIKANSKPRMLAALPAIKFPIPTGVPLKPEPRYVGVGQIVALVLKSDGSVAWIAEDYERSSKLYGVGAPYFDVYATDKAGTRLLASGTGIDPSSLALSVGDFGVNGFLRTVVGSTVYWAQGGKSESASLD